MAKAATKRIEEAIASTPAPKRATDTITPVGIMKIGKEESACPSDVAAAVKLAYDAKMRLDIAKLELDDLHERIGEAVKEIFKGQQTKTLHIIVDNVDCQVALKDTVVIDSPETLKAVLGERYSDLVREKITYTPERRLIDLACNPDDPLASEVKICLATKTAKPSFTYKRLAA